MLQVRLGLMPSDYFINNVKNNPLVMENEACKPVIINAMKTMFDLSMDESTNQELIHQLTRPRLPSEILLAIGGWSGGNPTNEIEAYDVKADRWVSVTQDDEHPRAYHGTAVLEEFVYCVGGYDGVEYFNSVRKCNLITHTFHEVSNVVGQRVTLIQLPLQKKYHCTVMVSDFTLILSWTIVLNNGSPNTIKKLC